MNPRVLDWPAIFRFFGLLVVALLLAITGFFYWAATHPGSAWKTFVQPRIFSRDTQIKTASATFNVTKISWREWKVDWILTGLQIHRQSPALSVTANAKLTGTLRIWKPNTEFHITGAEFISETAPLIYESPPGESKPQSPFQMANEWRQTLLQLNRYVRIDMLNLSIHDLQLGSTAKGGQRSRWKISGQKPSAIDPLASIFVIEGLGADPATKVTSLIRMDQFGNGSPFLKTEIELSAKEWGTKSQIEVGATDAQITATVKGQIQYGKIKGGLDSQLVMTQAQMALKGKTDLENVPGPVPEIKGLDWDFQVPLSDNQWFGTQPGRVTAVGPLSLIFVKKDIRDVLETACKCKFPDRLNARVEGSLWPGNIMQRSEIEQPVANVKVNLDPIQNSMMQMSLNGQFTVINRGGKLHYWPVVEGQAKFLDFQIVKAVLEANHILVPSPFDVLNGTIEVSSKTAVTPNENGVITIPAEVKVNLSSPSQKIVMNSTIQALIPPGRKSVEVYANLNIDDFIIELPPVDPIHGLPKLVTDSRLLGKPAPIVDDDFKVRFIYDVRTSKPGAIRLLSKLARPAIPVSVDVDRTRAGDTRGIVKSEPFELSYMHRTLFVDGLRLILDDRETADFAVDGRLRMEQSQYKVNIIVSGTIRSPLIKLTSEPELGRSDIISVILYDRTSDQLVAADRETVGVFDSAVADRAIGLLGLWVFASTPIRSFHYNPATKVYTATVQLAEGTTASLGTDWEEAAQVEVRKRVTKRWVLTASWKPGTEERSQTGKLVLQWEKRF